MAMKKNTIPDRWLEYSNIGEPISGTRFVAFKVPLGENFFLKLRPNDRFGPGHLFEALPHLGLVIDLTNTDRYYQPELFARSGIRHQKIACPGRAIPADRIVRKFCNVAHEFLRHTATDGSLIGVHCTHGINRSGYMICSYMIREMLMNPRDAIAAFEVARGHNIERKEYIDALLNLRPDGSISDRQRIMDTEYLGETGPSSSTGTIGIGQGYRHSTQWNSHSELPDGVVRMRPNSLFTVGPSTSTRSPWFSISGPEVNIRPTTSGSPDSTWSSMTGTVAGSFERNFSSNIHGYSTIPRLHTAGMYTRTHLPYTTSRPGTDLNIEPEHSSTAEYGSSQRERPMADGFSDPNTTQQIRGLPARPLRTPWSLPYASVSSSSHPSSARHRRDRRRRGTAHACQPANSYDARTPATQVVVRSAEVVRARGGKMRKRRAKNGRERGTPSQQEEPRALPKLGQSEKNSPT